MLLHTNVSVLRVALITRRHLEGMAAKCQLAQLEEKLVDISNANIRIPELQRKFYAKMKDPDEMSHEAPAYERAIENQSQSLSIKTNMVQIAHDHPQNKIKRNLGS